MSDFKLKILRDRHPTLRYENYSFFEVGENQLKITFDFLLEPDIRFKPTVTIPYECDLPKATLENFIFNLGMVEVISYWKAACPPKILVKAGFLNEAQIAWWRDLFIHGLGEFYCQNNIDFSEPDFLEIVCDSNVHHKAQEVPSLKGDLILVAGGKDSALTLELLKNSGRAHKAFALNPTPAVFESVKNAEYDSPLVANRTIDPMLLELNKKNYLNGHTPFSAYLAFLGTLVAASNGYKDVIVSNEASASEENLLFHGLPVNHQYSKGVRFEGMFREYVSEFLTPDVNYFSFLRPLSELQVSRLFATHTNQHRSFRSCNVHRSEGSWCGECSKCAFVFLMLAPWIRNEELFQIFDGNLFEKPGIQKHIIDLVGLGDHKPFECVGTAQESRVALALAVLKASENEIRLPNALLEIAKSLPEPLEFYETKHRSMLLEWKENFLPAEHEKILKTELTRICGAI